MNRLPEFEDDLGWRQLLRANAPRPERTRDLWGGIAIRLPALADGTSGTPAAALGSHRSVRRRQRRGVASLLLASACLLGLVVLGLPLHALRLAPHGVMVQAHPLDTLLLREAEGLEREYAAAFAQFEQVPPPTALQPGLQALDAEGRRIRLAMIEHPRQSRLLSELRRVHERRLDLLLRSRDRDA